MCSADVQIATFLALQCMNRKLRRDGCAGLADHTQMSIDREHIGLARPLDEVVLECDSDIASTRRGKPEMRR
jgi:hypothetical protein